MSRSTLLVVLVTKLSGIVTLRSSIDAREGKRNRSRGYMTLKLLFSASFFFFFFNSRQRQALIACDEESFQNGLRWITEAANR